jgi:uncharacterized OsmC-like protein
MSSQSTARKPRPEPTPRNGVNTPALFATIGVVKDQPQLAQFRFRATNKWIAGTHSRSRMEPFTGAGGVHTHGTDFQLDGDHPTVLTGADQGPTPVEYILHALASCLTAGIANIAAARGVNLTSVESTVEGDIDLRGILGLSNEVRNGYQGIRASFRIRGDAPEAKLAEIVAQSQARSAVFDILTGQVPVAITVDAG